MSLAVDGLGRVRSLRKWVYDFLNPDAGKYRLEGKEYIVKDGDVFFVLTFNFKSMLLKKYFIPSVIEHKYQKNTYSYV